MIYENDEGLTAEEMKTAAKMLFDSIRNDADKTRDSINPTKNSMIRIESVPDARERPPEVDTRAPVGPDVIDFDELKAAFRKVAANEYGIHPGVELCVADYGDGPIYEVNDKSIYDAPPNELKAILHAASLVRTADEEAAKAKYTLPSENPLIKTDY
jgi:hypothetical protein